MGNIFSAPGFSKVAKVVGVLAKIFSKVAKVVGRKVVKVVRRNSTPIVSRGAAQERKDYEMYAKVVISQLPENVNPLVVPHT